MKISMTRVHVAAGAVALTTAVLGLTGQRPAPQLEATVAAAAGPARPALASVSIPFEKNEGQFDRSTAFMAQTAGAIVLVDRDGTVGYHVLVARALPRAAPPEGEVVVAAALAAGPSLPGPVTACPKPDGQLLPNEFMERKVPEASETSVMAATIVTARERVLAERWVGAGAVVPAGHTEAGVRISRFLGNDPSRWQRDIRAFDTIALGEPWPGIGVTMQARGGEIEKLFEVAPGADPARIRIRLDGASAVRADANGELVADSVAGEIRFSRPVAWQAIDGQRRAVEVAYAVAGDEYGFTLGAFDPAAAVVIDPIVRTTYVGGSGYDDSGRQMAIDPASGAVYVAGITTSSNLPATGGSAQPFFAGAQDLYVAKLDPSLQSLTRITYVGGSQIETQPALAVHGATGDVYVGGVSLSVDFPAATGGADGYTNPQTCSTQTVCETCCFSCGCSTCCSSFGGCRSCGCSTCCSSCNCTQQTTCSGTNEVVVARLSADLDVLYQSTYLGGSGTEGQPALAIDGAAGQVYVGFHSDSTDVPGAGGGAQPANGGGYDIVLARLSDTLTGPLQASYFGGAGTEFFAQLLRHPLSGDVVAAGYGSSGGLTATSGGAQPSPAGGTDGFLLRLDADLTAVAQATYLGGFSDDIIQSLAVNAAGDVYVAGYTASTGLPGTANGAQTDPAGGLDSFVVQLGADLTSVTAGTYFGGAADDLDYALLTAGSDVYLAGHSASADLPSRSGGLQAAHAGGASDAFIVRLDEGLTTVRQATYLGGSSGDELRAIAMHPNGDLYAVGMSFSTDFPAAATGAQTGKAGSWDLFVARVTPDLKEFDTVPEAFTFGSLADVARGAVLAAGPVTISGLTAAADVAVADGSYSIGCTDTYTTDAGSITDGQTVCVQHTAAAAFGTTVTTTLTVGGVAGTFASTTLAEDTEPAAFDFDDVSDVPRSTAQVSAPITISGINTSVAVAVLDGEYSLGCDGTFTADSGTIEDGGTVCVRHVSSSAFGTAATTTLMVGGVGGGFTSTTVAEDITPEAFSFVDVAPVEPASLQVSGTVTVAGINSSAPIAVVNGFYSINGGPATAADGVVVSGDVVTVQHTASAGYETVTDTVLTIGANGVLAGVSDTFSSTTRIANTTPAAFAFDDQSGVDPSAPVTAMATLSGLEAAAPIEVLGGEYSAGCTGTYTGAAGSVNNGAVCVRHVASSSFNAATHTVLTVGGVSDTFTSETRAPVTTPAAFTLADAGGVEPGATVTSAPITVTGIEAPTSISVADGQYAVGCSVYTAAAGTVGNGQTVCVRHTASGAFQGTASTQLTVGGVSDTFSSTTRAADTTPDAFAFADRAGVEPGATVTSPPVTVSGIEVATPISVSNGEYSIGCGATFTGAAGSISAGQTLCVRHAAAAVHATGTETIVTIGGISDTFSSTTRAADTTPNAFAFADVEGAALSTEVVSAAVTVTGLLDPASISVGGDGVEYSVNDGPYTAAVGSVGNGASLRLRMTSAPSVSTPRTGTVTIGGITDTWVVKTGTVEPVTGTVASGGGALGWQVLALLGVALAWRRRAALTFALAFVGTAGAADPSPAGKQPSWYVGVRGGSVSANQGADTVTRDLRARGHNATVTFDDGGSGGFLYVGYICDSRTSVELAYGELGTYEATVGGSSSNMQAFADDVEELSPKGGSAAVLNLRWSFHLPWRLAVAPRAGLYHWNSGTRYTGPGGVQGSGAHETGVGFMAGLTLEQRYANGFGIGFGTEVFRPDRNGNAQHLYGQLEYRF